MKTVFITSFHVLISRNILSTPFLAELTRDPDVRVVLFVPAWKRGYFAQRFGSDRVIVEGVPVGLGAFDRALRTISLAALDTRSTAVKRQWESVGRARPIRFLFRSALGRATSGRRAAIRLVRWLDSTFAPAGQFSSAFARYRPGLVFSTDIQNESDLAVMREARRRRVPVVGMVRSWDNLTAKGLLRIVPDVLVVENELVRDEAVRYHAIPAERIAVIGIPHYDRYVTEPPTPRDAFLRSLGFNPKGKLVLVAPIGDRYLRENVTDRGVLELLVRARDAGRLPADLQVLVRLPPTDSVNLAGFRPPAWVRIERPGVEFRSGALKERELDPADDRRLADSIAASDAVVAGPSTVCVDAAALDRPVVLVGFDNGGRGYLESAFPWYDYDHFRAILASGGARLARTEGEFVRWLAAYLERPETDREGRERIRREQCFLLDGRATERLAGILRSLPAGASAVSQP